MPDSPRTRPSRSTRTLHVFADGGLVVDGVRLSCTLGRSGISDRKVEGDGATPVGLFPVRSLWFRHEYGRPVSALPAHPIGRRHGWCDDPGRSDYNRPVRLPFGGSHEVMRRDDRLYDLVLTIGHNDRPVRAGGGSAVFVHLMSPERASTEGCVALRRLDLEWLLHRIRPGDLIRVHRPGCRTPSLPPRQDLR